MIMERKMTEGLKMQVLKSHIFRCNIPHRTFNTIKSQSHSWNHAAVGKTDAKLLQEGLRNSVGPGG